MHQICRESVNAHFYPSTLEHESRIEKICGAISRTGVFSRVEVFGVAADGLPEWEEAGGVIWRRLRRSASGRPELVKKIMQTRDWSRKVKAALWDEPLHCVNSHSVATLPLGVALKRRHGARLIYDTHELETETNSLHGLKKALYKGLERKWIGEADEVVVVSDSIADWYARAYRIKRPLVIRNLPHARQFPDEGGANILRQRFGVPETALLFIYQGGLFGTRNLERLARVFARAHDDRHIVFMGFGDLENLVRDAASRFPNIHYQPAVPPDEILAHTAGADVGFWAPEMRSLSYLYSLPNKLFEYAAAGVPAIVGDGPDMRRFVEQEGCGWVVKDDEEGLLGLINSLERDDVERKKKAAREAREKYRWEEEVKKLELLYRGASDGGN